MITFIIVKATMFKRLVDALVHLKNSEQYNQLVMAEDVSQQGQKVFYVQNVDILNEKYKEIDKKHWYECLLEDKASRIFLDIESETAVDLSKIIVQLKAAVREKFHIEPNIHILDSCSATKQSWHVIVTNIYLKNVYHVGAFVRRLVLFTDEPSIDTAVYTKNRMFRCAGSSKFGSERILRGASNWLETLVQWPYPETVLECLEIDGSEPVSQSRSPAQLFEYVDGQWISKIQSNGSAALVQSEPPFLGPLLNALNTRCGGHLYRHKLSMTERGQLFCSTKSKQCAIAGREHRGNNIWYEIDLEKQRIYQRCYDAECRGKRHEIFGLDQLWIQWNVSWDVQKHDHIWCPERFSPKNENTLYNMGT